MTVARKELARINEEAAALAIENLARQLRQEALSGYAWNVAPTWETAHPVARERWREKARARFIAAHQLGEMP